MFKYIKSVGNTLHYISDFVPIANGINFGFNYFPNK